MSANDKKHYGIGAVALAIAVFFWASAYVGIRVGVTYFDPGALGFLRYLIASVTMGVVYLLLKNKRKPNLKDFLLFLVAGGIGIGFYNISLNYGEVEVTAATSGFIISTIPVLVFIFSLFFLSEKPHPLGISGMVIALMGIVMIFVAKDGWHLTWDVGLLHVCASTIAGAMYILLQKPMLKKFHPLEIASWSIWCGTLVSAFYAPHAFTQLVDAPIKPLLSVLYLGIFPGAISYAGWSVALRYLPTTKATGALFIVPLITTILGWLVLGEMPLLWALLGGLVALLGAFLIHKTP